MSAERFPDLFDMPPYPNMYRVGLGVDVGHLEFLNDGRVLVFDSQTAEYETFIVTPDQADEWAAVVAHLERYREQWEAGRVERERITSQPDSLPADPRERKPPEIVRIDGEETDRGLQEFALR
jgi:hypothetical protein